MLMSEVLVDHGCNLLVQQTFQGYEAPFCNSRDLMNFAAQVGEKGTHIKYHEITTLLDLYTYRQYI